MSLPCMTFLRRYVLGSVIDRQSLILLQAEGDLSFGVGDRIELVQRTESTEDWWTGRLNGQEGVFPGL